MMISSPRAPKTCLHVIYNDMALRTLEATSLSVNLRGQIAVV